MDAEIIFVSDDRIEHKRWVNKEDWDFQINYRKFAVDKRIGNIPQDMTYEEYVAQQKL